MTTLLGILQAIIALVPALDRLLRSLRKTPQEKVEKGVEEVRSEIEDFKRTGRPPQ